MILIPKEEKEKQSKSFVWNLHLTLNMKMVSSIGGILLVIKTPNKQNTNMCFFLFDLIFKNATFIQMNEFEWSTILACNR